MSLALPHVRPTCAQSLPDRGGQVEQQGPICPREQTPEPSSTPIPCHPSKDLPTPAHSRGSMDERAVWHPLSDRPLVKVIAFGSHCVWHASDSGCLQLSHPMRMQCEWSSSRVLWEPIDVPTTLIGSSWRAAWGKYTSQPGHDASLHGRTLARSTYRRLDQGWVDSICRRGERCIYWKRDQGIKGEIGIRLHGEYIKEGLYAGAFAASIVSDVSTNEIQHSSGRQILPMQSRRSVGCTALTKRYIALIMRKII